MSIVHHMYVGSVQITLSSLFFLHLLSSFPFIHRQSTHSLVQSVFPHLCSLYGPVVIPVLDIVQLVPNSRHEGLVVSRGCGIKAYIAPGLQVLSLFLDCEGKQTRSEKLPALVELLSNWSSTGTKTKEPGACSGNLEHI